jgi:hypothetical protein
MVHEICSKDVVAIIGTAVALGGFGFGLYQYQVAQKWKRSELAARQLEMLSTDPKLAMCCQFLDWKSRRVPYQSITGFTPKQGKDTLSTGGMN